MSTSLPGIGARAPANPAATVVAGLDHETLRDAAAIPERDTTIHAPVQAVAPTYHGTRRAFARLLVGGLWRILVTLGLYRFWLITDLRRHLLGHTLVGGEPLEYTGRAGELLRGFLIGTAIIVPINFLLLFFLADSPQAAVIALPILFLLWGLHHFAQFRVFGYRIARTRYRAMAGALDASLGGYLRRVLRWDFVIAVTLGLALPWRRAALDRYLLGHCRVGDQSFGFSGSGTGLALRVYAGWLMTLLGWAIVALGASQILLMTTGHTLLADHSVSSYTRFALLGLVLASLYLVYVAIWHRWRLTHVRIGPMRMVSHLPIRRVLFCYLRFLASIGLLLATVLALFFGAITFLGTSYPEESAALMGSPDEPSTFAQILAYVVIILILTLISALRRFFLERGLWIALTTTLVLQDLDRLDDRLASGNPTSTGGGEGLADAFEFSG